MKFLLVNDTIKSKNLGCQLVSNQFRKEIKKYNKEISFDSIWFGRKWGKKIYRRLDSADTYDFIYVNGEGSLGGAFHKKTYRATTECLKKNKNVYLCNFTFDPRYMFSNKLNYTTLNLWLDVFKKCKIVSVRDPISYRFLKKQNFDNVKLFPDIGTTICEDSLSTQKNYLMFGVGAILKHRAYNNKNTLYGFEKIIKHFSKERDCFIMNFPSSPFGDGVFLKSIKGKNIYHIDGDYKNYHNFCKQSILNITGRHHGVVMSYASACPYLTFRSNMWKTEGDCFLYGNFGSMSPPHKENVDEWIQIIEENIHKKEQNRDKLIKRQKKLKKYHDGHVRVIFENDLKDIIEDDNIDIDFNAIDEFLNKMKNKQILK